MAESSTMERLQARWGSPNAYVYAASGRAYPERLLELTYPSEWLVRRVCDRGEMRWQGSKVFVTRVLDGELVGLEALDERYWRLWLGPRALGVLDGRRQRLLTRRELRQAGWSELLLGRAFRCAAGPAQEPLNVLPMSPD